MDLVVFDRSEIVVVLRALAGVASANGTFTRAESDLVEGIGRLHGIMVEAESLEPVSPEEVAAAVRDPHRRKRVVQLAVIAALVEGLNEAGEHAVRDLARELNVPGEDVELLHDAVHHNLLFTRFDIVRRMRRFVGGGIGALATFVAPFLGLGVDPSLAARYRALGDLPQGTLGHALYAHYVEHGFHFPGEPDGIPERFVFHDVGHVLAGYGVDPPGEIQQAAFQAGFVRNDGFLFLVFGILQFHHGMRLTPVAKGEHGYFDVDKVLRAAARGAACKIDLSDRFDLWAHAAENVDDLRAKWGIA
jgi:hypothetical protein